MIQHPESVSSLKVILRILSIFSRDMGIQSFLIFGDICQKKKMKDTGYFVKKLMGYGILGPPPFQGLISVQLANFMPNKHTSRRYSGSTELQ